jgi:hypothetical protein
MISNKNYSAPAANALLELSNEALEDVMAAVHLWADKRKPPLGSAAGQQAMRLAAEHRRTLKLTASQLHELLARSLIE